MKVKRDDDDPIVALRFLQFCLDEQAPLPMDIIQDIHWDELLVFAKEQALVGIYFEGIKRLGNISVNRPSQMDIMRWAGLANKIAVRNQLLSDYCVKVSHKFARVGFDSFILKGQGCALMYPNPEARTSGDIDIWLVKHDLASSGTGTYSLCESRKQIVGYVRSVLPHAEACYHHIDFSVTSKCPIEVHFTPGYVSDFFANLRLQRWYAQQMIEMKSDGLFPVPTDAFNRIFLMCHIQHHFFDEGIGLRQLIDYYYLLRRGCSEEERIETEKRFRSFGMMQTATAVMWVMQHVLGLDERYLLVTPHEARGRMLLREMMEGGNFGKKNGFRRYNMAEKYWVKTWRNLRKIWLFPNEAIWEPIFRTGLFFWKKAVT